MDPDSEKPGPWKTRETAGCKKKKIGRPHGILYCSNEFMQEETCEKTIWKNSYWGCLGIQEMYLRLRVKMNWKVINK